MTDKTFPGKARTVALPSGPPPPPAPMPPRPGGLDAATDPRGLAALAERLHKQDVLNGCNDECEIFACAILGPSGRFSPDGGLDAIIAKAYTDGYAAGLANEVDDWNADAETLAEYGRHYAAALATPKEEQG